MKRRIDNQPGYCYVVTDEPQPGIYESMRVVKRDGKFKVKANYNDTNTGTWVSDISSMVFDTVEAAIKAMEHPNTLGFRFGYGETRVI